MFYPLPPIILDGITFKPLYQCFTPPPDYLINYRMHHFKDILPPQSTKFILHWGIILNCTVTSYFSTFHCKTRMRSSRMRTACSSSHLLGGVCLSACWDTPPRHGPGPPARPTNYPLALGLDTPPEQNS